MGNNQVKQSMKCFYCNDVAFVTISNRENSQNFNIIITMECPNPKCNKQEKLTLKEYFDHRHSFRSQRIPCKSCGKHEKEMYLCNKCQEETNENNPIIFCLGCQNSHKEDHPGHVTLPMDYLNSKCFIHKKNFVAYDEDSKKNICEDCINDENNKINKEKIIYFDKIKFSENEIEDMLEKVKIQMGKINTIKMLSLTKEERENAKFKEYLQNKMYFIELEWLIIGEIIGTPNNYQVIQNIRKLIENKYNTLKNNEIFNDEDPIGLLIKKIIEEKNNEKKVIYTSIKP